MLPPSTLADALLKLGRHRLGRPRGVVCQHGLSPQRFRKDAGNLGQVLITEDRDCVARPTRRPLAL